MLTSNHGESGSAGAPRRDVRTSLKRGFAERCPACGVGRLFQGYLAVNDACPCCGEELHHQRADDFPQYVTIFIVAHLLVAAFLAADELWPNLPVAVHYAVWPMLVVVLCLVLLPRIKGALVAYQWALRMHGFETAHVVAAEHGAAEDATHPAHRSAA